MTVIADQPRQLGHRDAMDFLAIQFIVGVVQQSIPRAPLQQRYIVFYLDCRAMLDDFLFLIHTISPDQVYSWGIYRYGRRKEIKISSTLESLSCILRPLLLYPSSIAPVSFVHKWYNVLIINGFHSRKTLKILKALKTTIRARGLTRRRFFKIMQQSQPGPYRTSSAMRCWRRKDA